VLYLDEIAPMQLYVPEFATFASKVLDSDNPVLGTIKQDNLGYGFINKVKARRDCLILTLDDTTRPSIEAFLQALARKLQKSQNYLQEHWRFRKVSTHNVIMQSEHGERILHRKKEMRYCDCKYYVQYHTCSHSIALRQIYYRLP